MSTRSDPFAAYASPSRKHASGAIPAQPKAGKTSSPFAVDGRSGSNSRPNSRGSTHAGLSGAAPHDRASQEDDLNNTARSSGSQGVRGSRDAPLRASREGRSLAPSPYLQPPAGRPSPSSRPAVRQSTPVQAPAPHQPPGTPNGNSSTARQVSPTLRASLAAGTGAGTGSIPLAANSSGARLMQAYGMAPRGGTAGGTGLSPPHMHVGGSSQASSHHGPRHATHAHHPHPRGGAEHDPHHAHHHSPYHQHGSPGHRHQAHESVAQQVQHAGPRATTAVSGPRSAQRVRQDSATGSSTGEPGSYSATSSPPPPSMPGRDVEMSFGYDDIPEEDDESGSPSTTNLYSGLTLDQYMQRMVTTPASAAATSGLGVSNEEETAATPQSPGGASNRTEEEDTSPYSSLAYGSAAQAAVLSAAAAAAAGGLGAEGYGPGGAGVSGPGAPPIPRTVSGSRLLQSSGSSRGGLVPSGPGAGAGSTVGGAQGFPSGPARINVGHPAGSGSGTAPGTPGGGGALTPTHGGARTNPGTLPEGLSPRGGAAFGSSAPSGVRRTSSSSGQVPGRGSGSFGPAASRAVGLGSVEEEFPSAPGGIDPDLSALLEDNSSDEEGPHPVMVSGGAGGHLSGGVQNGVRLSGSNGSPHPAAARRMSARASAFSNNLDLRPATAAAVSSPSSRDVMGGSGGHRGARGSLGMGDDMGLDLDSHNIIKQVDLGGLSASLFTPSAPVQPREPNASPASSAATTLHGSESAIMSGASSPDVPALAARRMGAPASASAAAAMLSTSPPQGAAGGAGGTDPGCAAYGGGSGGAVGGGAMAHVWGVGGPAGAVASPKSPMVGSIPPPWGVSAREGVLSSNPGDGSASPSSRALASRPLSSRGRPGSVSAGPGATLLGGGGAAGTDGQGAGAGAAPPMAGRPASGNKWASKQALPTKAPSGPQEADLPPEARLLMAETHGAARPPTRQVQSARPPGARAELELDPSVWQANIAMQLQRPPSRQKPPPEALHLWTPEQQIGMLAAGGLGRNAAGRPMGRPQSAAPTAYRSSRPTSGPMVKAQGPGGEEVGHSSAIRPPSRQKPPPMSVLLEHDDFPPPPPPGQRRARPGAEQLAVVVSDSSEFDEGDSDLE